MKIINLKKQAKNSRFCSLALLLLFTRPHEKPWKRKHSWHTHLIALSPNISSLENEAKSPSILICNEKKNQIFYMLWQYKLDKNFDLTFEENRSLLSSMTAKICFKMLMKLLVNHFLSTEFSIGDWQTLKLVLFYNHFFRLQWNSKCSSLLERGF